jgi:hypothetical protein
MGQAVTPIEKTSRRKPGRPRKYGQGRINATVRFTPERYAELQAEADQKGRSLSEQVEHMVEQTRLLRELVDQLKVAFSSANYDAKGLLRRLDDREAAHTAELEALKMEHAAELAELRVTAAALGADRLAEIIEARVVRALAKSR